MRYVVAGDTLSSSTAPSVAAKPIKKKGKVRAVPSGDRRPFGPIIGAFVV